MGCFSRWNIVRETCSWSMLTLDFLARQLLQAAVVRLRFRTGASAIDVVNEVDQAGSVSSRVLPWTSRPSSPPRG